MASEIRVNQIQNRSGLSTVTFTDTGLVISGVTTVSGILNAPEGVVGNITGNVNTTGVSTISQLNVGVGGTIIKTTIDGRVGIGTENPQVKFHVSDGETILRSAADAQVPLRIQRSSSSGRSQFTLEDETGSQIWRVGSTGSGSSDFSFYNGNNRLTIDSSGRVTMPYQPAFFARPPASYDIGVGGNIIGGTWVEDYDRTNSFSNGTFTAPVSGWYCLTWNVFLTLEATRQDAYILRNGTEIMREEINGYTGTFNRSVSVHGSYQLAANDTITYGVHSNAGNTLYLSQNPWGYACGFLVG